MMDDREWAGKRTKPTGGKRSQKIKRQKKLNAGRTPLPVL